MRLWCPFVLLRDTGARWRGEVRFIFSRYLQRTGISSDGPEYKWNDATETLSYLIQSAIYYLLHETYRAIYWALPDLTA